MSRKELNSRDKLHNILSSLNIKYNGGYFPIKEAVEFGKIQGLDEMHIRRELKKRVKDGFIIIDKEMMKLGC